MTTQSAIALSSRVDLEKLTGAERKKLPFYEVTADPFGALDKWKNLIQDSTFMDALRGVVDLNESAIKQNESNSGWSHVHYGFERPDKPIKVHGADISLIALMISLEQTIKAQHGIASKIGFFCGSDLSNLHELFETVNKSKPRSYHNTMIQMLTWFYKVRYEFYEFDVKTIRDEKFRDFERIGGSPDGIRERIKSLRDGKMYIEVGREVEFVFDFRNATTELVINHGNYRKCEILEAIQRKNPFANQDRANILFPIGTAGWVLPLINLTKITVESWDGRKTERLTFEGIKNPKLRSQVQGGVRGLLENNQE